uniref:Uncharacterized protein n=1 Tax=Romanomermis culicivorax TaxID=13658 RepID=A0A915JQ05_ROMCU
MTDGNSQPNRTERKFPFRFETLCRLHSVTFRSAEKGNCVKAECCFTRRATPRVMTASSLGPNEPAVTAANFQSLLRREDSF